MAHYAKVENGLVTEVLVAEQDFIDTLDGVWVQTSYNTVGGVHLTGGVPLRKNYAMIGSIYDIDMDAFYAPAPYPSWTLDEETCQWGPPVDHPNDGGSYKWDEPTRSWVSHSIA